MPVIYADVDEELERKFKIEVIRRYGTRRGAIAQAVKEAIQLWLETQKVEKSP